ncbi:MAG: hypothetical protein ACE5IJ_02520 [Thermoplasmata archaeon]
MYPLVLVAVGLVVYLWSSSVSDARTSVLGLLVTLIGLMALFALSLAVLTDLS